MSLPNQREEAIFEAALALPPEQRGAYLDQACGDDAVLRGQVAALLEAHAQTGGLLEQTVAPLRGPLSALSQPLTEKPGDRIGRYKLLQQIGEGGCGVVYMAEQQEPVKRRVALKVIKPGMDTRQVLARFEAERQALALMDHPNIAKVLDAGATEAGRPYFVMELVRGTKITDYCDDPDHALPTAQRLELFIQVCRAIQHAHQKGIIHRDIKPSNVLVSSLEDGTPTPKIIDFGIAKATAGQTLTDMTVYTAFEQFIGTPAYMSPEQAAMVAPDIDTRSDIYSLGVLLYELLTGKTPFDSKRLLEAGFDEVRRIIREEAPPRPSTRLTILDAEEQTTVAKRHRTEAPRLIRLMRGDLDWIVMKCLEKDRTRRYETANGLAMDILRHMGNQAILACPPSRIYRLRKLVRRHKFGFAAASAVAISAAIALLELGLRMSERASTAEKERRAQADVAAKESNLRQQAQSEAQRARAAATEAKLTLAASDFSQAVHLMAENRGDDALAYLARSLSSNPESDATATKMAAWLTQHSWPAPVASFKHSNSVSIARFSPDGKRVLTVGSGSKAWVWDAQTGRVPADALKHDGEIRAAEFSPDGSRIVTGSDDKTARVWDARTGQPLSAPMRHNGRVNSAQFSPDGNLVATASRDKTAQIWDWRGAQPIGEPLKHDGEVRSVEFSPDGKKVLTASDDTTARLWDARSGKPLGQPMKHEKWVVSARFSPDGRQIVTACPEGTAQVWSAETGKSLTRPFSGIFGVWSACFSSDSKRIVTTSWGKTACVWSAETGQQVLPPLEHGEKIESAQFAPQGRFLLTGARDCTARIWDAESARPIGEHIRHSEAVVSAQFSPDGQRVLVGSRDGTACVWDVRAGEPITRPVKHGVGPGQLDFDPDGKGIKRMNAFLLASGFADFSPDGKRMVTASVENTARIWDVETGELVAESLKHTAAVNSAQFSRDGKWIVTASRDHTARVWDAETGRPVTAPLNHEGWVMSSQFSADGKHIVTASQDGTARLWDAQTGVSVCEPMRHASGVISARFNHDGGRVLTASWDGTARVWDASSGQPTTAPLKHGSWVWSARFSVDGTRIVTASEDQTARVWDAQTGVALTAPMRHGAAVYFADFSPDGKQVITASAAGEARLWDAQTGHVLAEPLKHSDTVYCARFSPDGKWLVTASWDRTVRIWDSGTGQPLTEPLNHNGPVWSAQFSPGGRRILTASTDGTARVWDLAPTLGEHPDWLLRLAEAVSGRTLNKRGVLESVVSDRAASLNQIRQELASRRDEEEWVRWGRWLLADRFTRSMSPFSNLTISEYVQNRIKQNTAESLDEAEKIAFGNPEPLRRIAQARETLHPDIPQDRQAELSLSNGVAQARAGKWKQAIAEFSKLVKLEPDNPTNYHSLAALLVQDGDLDAYRRHCAQVLARFGQTQDPVTAERMAKDCLILPLPEQIAPAARLAHTALTSGTNHPYLVYFQLAKGLAEYRQGNLESAKEWIQKVVASGGDPARRAEAQFVLAMVQYGSSELSTARSTLASGIEMVEQLLPSVDRGDIGPSWIDWLIAHALMRDAKALIESTPKTEHPPP
jgi:WD40 repeat protein/serine/threonine protein kinase